MTTAHTVATRGMICNQAATTTGGGPQMPEEPLKPLIKVLNVVMEKQDERPSEGAVIVKSVKLVVDPIN